MTEAKKALASMGIDLDTDVFQQKLRAISKHAEALADELEYIDKAKCEECGGLMNITNLYADNNVVQEIKECPRCDNDE